MQKVPEGVYYILLPSKQKGSKRHMQCGCVDMHINLLRKRKHLHAYVPTHVVEVMWFTEGRFRGFGAHVVAWMSWKERTAGACCLTHFKGESHRQHEYLTFHHSLLTVRTVFS